MFLKIWSVLAGSVPTGSAVRAGSVRAGSRYVSVCAGSVRAGSVLAVPVRFVATLFNGPLKMPFNDPLMAMFGVWCWGHATGNKAWLTFRGQF